MTILHKKKVYIVFAIIALIIIVFISYTYIKEDKPDNIRDFPEIKASGELNAVTTYDPIGYYVSGDTINGFNYELLQLLQTYTDVKINISLEADLEKSILGLTSGKYDIIVRNFPTTSPMRDTLNFTEPVAVNKLVLIQRKSKYNNGTEPIRSHLDLAGKTLFIQKNSPTKLRIENLAREIGDNIHYVEDSLYGGEQLAMKVAAHEIDYSVLDEKTAQRLSASLPEIDYETKLDFIHFEAWAVRKNAPILLDSLNKWIVKMKENPQYKKIYNSYYK